MEELTGEPGVEDGVVDQDVHLPAADQDHPAVTRLDDDLLEALRSAAEDAVAEGVSIGITSGWRSERYQEDLFEDAVDEHGSHEAASRWAATAETSQHVSGDAVDVGPYDAIDWMRRHGADYGLCQIYANESWHYELRPEAVTRGCPPKYADPGEDPRLQR
ncbi:M15 family metallopeptidase [Nesterenkonia sp. F]|uniref:M15 family metallopeptidase n=1 Tax=Nesterenkonia sp. F TaxID=795955 RepID=UPI000255D38D|nr:M15 family metallopeptidase [Nesterenkonia sp. F]